MERRNGVLSLRAFFEGVYFGTVLLASGRFIKRNQRGRWQAKRELVSGSKHRGRSAAVRGYHPHKNYEFQFAKSCSLVQFLP